MAHLSLSRFPGSFRVALATALVATMAIPFTVAQPPERLALEAGNRIVLVGNTLAERMQYDGQWETLLHSRFPQLKLVVRNLGWSADEIDLRPRSQDFQDHGHRLEDHQPDVIVAMFGFNESFAGNDGLEPFRANLRSMIGQYTATTYNGKSPPKLVLCSPLPHENLRRRELPDGTGSNLNLQRYTDAMREEAHAAGIMFIDLFSPLRERFEGKDDLTINGIHLNEAGHAVVAKQLDESLFGPRGAGTKADMERLRREVKEKDLQFWYDYRAVNGFYIYGGRKEPFGTRNFPLEFQKLRQMIDNRDQRIWSVAAGESVADAIDDSNTLALPVVESNVPGETKIFTPEEQLATFKLPEGFKIELYASEREFPDLQKPVAMTFDGKGRMWVCTMPSYPMYLPGTPVDDKILILSDENFDGRAESCKTFADGLHLPIGIELGDGGAYVSTQPNLTFFKDTDGDERADQSERMLHGFDTADSHHSISVMTWGPGGEMYFQEGTFHRTQVETPRGPVRAADAAVFRWEPRTGRFDVFTSYPFANPWGHCFDRWGQNFVADASNGYNYFAAAFSGQLDYPRKHRQMKTFLPMQWRPTCGCEFVSSRHFPESWQGDYLLNNCIGFQGILHYRVREEGSGFAADAVEPLLQSSDVAFRPVDIKFGPDGALYIVDWYNPLVGHMQHSLRDPKRDKVHGRIWRITYTGNKTLDVPEIAGEPLDRLLEMLKSYEDRTRYAVRRELRERPTKEVVTAVNRWLKGLDKEDKEYEHHRLEALWVLQHHDVVDPPLLTSLLASAEPRARAAAVRVLCYQRDRVLNVDSLLLERASSDEHPRVRLEALRAASFFDRALGGPIALAVLEREFDEYLEYTFEETADTLDGRRKGDDVTIATAMADRLASGALANERIPVVVRLLCRRGSADDLGRVFDHVVANPAIDVAIRRQALDSLAQAASQRGMVPTIAADRVASLLQSAQDPQSGELLGPVIDVVGSWKVGGLDQALQSLVNTSQDEGVIIRAIGALAQFDSADALTTIESIAVGSGTIATRVAAIEGLALRNSEKACNAWLPLLKTESAIGAAEIERLTASVLKQQSGPAALASVLQRESLPSSVAKVLLRAVYATGRGDATITDPLAKMAGMDAAAAAMSEEERSTLIAKVASEGDPARGEIVFRRQELNCFKCHQLSGAGGKIGPDLSGVGANSPIEYLVDSIVYPSKQIKEAFLTRKVVTLDGQVLTGVVVSRDDQRIVLRDAEGKDQTVAVADIEEEVEGQSLMPEGLHNLMSRQELVDLVRFLSELGKPGPYAVNQLPSIQRWQVLTDPEWVKKLKALPEGGLEQALAEIPDEAWTSGYAMIDGGLPIAAFTNIPAEPPMVLRGDFDVVEAGPLAVSATPNRDVMTVLMGRSVSPAGAQAVDVPVGRQKVFIVVETPWRQKRYALQVIRPEGAKTQYTIVGGE
jgi:putative heme-binding domain-containing protein